MHVRNFYLAQYVQYIPPISIVSYNDCHDYHSELPQLVKHWDLQAIIADRKGDPRFQFSDSDDYGEYMQPMVVVEALAQAQVSFIIFV